MKRATPARGHANRLIIERHRGDILEGQKGCSLQTSDLNHRVIDIEARITLENDFATFSIATNCTHNGLINTSGNKEMFEINVPTGNDNPCAPEL